MPKRNGILFAIGLNVRRAREETWLRSAPAWTHPGVMPTKNETDWSDDELGAAVDAYLKMLSCERAEKPYSKADINRSLRERGGGVEGRTKGSVEYRMQNISAVLHGEKLDFVEGYKPAKNVGAAVRVRIWKLLQKRGVRSAR